MKYLRKNAKLLLERYAPLQKLDATQQHGHNDIKKRTVLFIMFMSLCSYYVVTSCCSLICGVFHICVTVPLCH